MDWLLFLHVLSAFFLVAAVTAFWAIVVATRPAAALVSPPAAAAFARPATIAVSAGTVGTIVFGVWLAIADDDYAVWDAWVLVSIALWIVGTGAGERAGRMIFGDDANARSRGVVLHAVSSVAILAILVLMIWKPGA